MNTSSVNYCYDSGYCSFDNMIVVLTAQPDAGNKARTLGGPAEGSSFWDTSYATCDAFSKYVQESEVSASISLDFHCVKWGLTKGTVFKLGELESSLICIIAIKILNTRKGEDISSQYTETCLERPP